MAFVTLPELSESASSPIFFPCYLSHSRRLARVTVPDETPESLRTLVGIFVFVNFSIPAIIDPEKHGVVKSQYISTSQRETLTMVSVLLV